MMTAPLNPVPGSTAYHSSHGHPLVHGVFEWAKALATGDQVSSKNSGQRLLEAAARAGASQFVVDEMLSVMQRVVYATRPPEQGACGADGKHDPDADVDAIEWHEPDARRFYALDKRSGAELSRVLEHLRHQDRLIRRGVRPPNRLLFVGPSGTGKTTGALWLGGQLGVPVALVRIDAALGSLVGSTPRRVRKSLEVAWEKRAVTVLDEFEALAVPRANASPNVGQWSRETTTAILQLLQSLPEEQIVVGTTNYLHLVDPAAQRRMRKHVFFYSPDAESRRAMLAEWWKKAPHDRKAFEALIIGTEGFSGDVLERAAEEANLLAAARSDTAPISIHDVQIALAGVLAAAEYLAAGGDPAAFVGAAGGDLAPSAPAPEVA